MDNPGYDPDGAYELAQRDQDEQAQRDQECDQLKTELIGLTGQACP